MVRISSDRKTIRRGHKAHRQDPPTVTTVSGKSEEQHVRPYAEKAAALIKKIWGDKPKIPIALKDHKIPAAVEHVLDVALTPGSQHNLPPDESGNGAKMVEDDRIITKNGVRYFPLSLAAQLAQAPRQTLLHWIKNKTKFAGHALQSYDSPTAGKFYVSEESIERMANRFVRWPSTAPAGPVTIGKTDDQNGFLGLPDAARILRVSPRTMWLWATQGKAPSQEPPEVIKCTTSDHLYIRERDVLALKALVPRSGLQRGRRQPTPQP